MLELHSVSGIIVFFMAVYGLCYLMVDSKILSTHIPIRKIWVKIPFFRDLFSCYFCTGIWASLLLYLLSSQLYIHMMFAGAAAVLIINKLVEGQFCTGCSEKMKKINTTIGTDRAVEFVTKENKDGN